MPWAYSETGPAGIVRNHARQYLTALQGKLIETNTRLAAVDLISISLDGYPEESVVILTCSGSQDGDTINGMAINSVQVNIAPQP